MKLINKLFLIALTTLLMPQGALSEATHAVPLSTDEEKANPILGESIFNLSSTWTTQDKKAISLKDLRGHPAVLAMIFTNCKSACPLIVEDLKKIDKNLSEKNNQQLAFYLFSFDTKHDTPEQLKTFADARKIDLKRWTLLHGSAQAVRELAAVLGVRFKIYANGNIDHSNVITLLNSEGLIHHQQLGLSQDPKELVSKAVGISAK